MLDQVRVGAILRVISFGRGIGSTVSQAKSCMPISLYPGGNSGVEERHSLGSTHRRCLGGWRETFPEQMSKKTPSATTKISKNSRWHFQGISMLNDHLELRYQAHKISQKSKWQCHDSYVQNDRFEH